MKPDNEPTPERDKTRLRWLNKIAAIMSLQQHKKVFQKEIAAIKARQKARGKQ